MKRIVLNLKISLRSLASFKLRTALAVLGVFFGTFSLIIVSNLAGSLTLKTEQEIDNMGTNLIVVISGQLHRRGPNVPLASRAMTLTTGDAEAIGQSLPAVKQVSPSGFKAFPVRRENTVLKAVAVNGITANFSDIRNFPVAEGSPITEEDNRLQRKVALIGRITADKLFGSENPLGKTILVWRVPCRVIGVMSEKGMDLVGNDQDNQIFVPLTTFLRNFTNRDNVNIIYVQAISGEAIEPLRVEIEALLRTPARDQKGSEGRLHRRRSKGVHRAQEPGDGPHHGPGRIAAGASFLIGALGILSIMTLIVNERRMEIGIRRAVGSRKRDIVLQFLMESSFISLSGGAIGVVAGLLMSLAIARILGYPASVSALGLLMAFAGSVASGILAGIYPSLKATTIHPVDIIRS